MTLMQGTLADLDLASLAAVTSLGRTSLRLEVSDPAGVPVGHLVLKAGRVVSATAGEVHGRHAMQVIMRSTASTRFRLVHEPLDYVLSSALASVEELAELAGPRPGFARSSTESPPIEAQSPPRRSTSQGATRARMMQGRLDEFDLRTLIQTIGMGRSYVELEILNEGGSKVGIVGIKAGYIVSARTRDSQGIAAMSELLRSPTSFEFAVFRIDAELGAREALGTVSEILFRSQDPAPPPPSPSPAESIPEPVPIMEGSLSEFDVATLLQTVGCGRQHCALDVFDDQHVVGTIHMKSGVVVSAAAGTRTAIPALRHLAGLQAPHRFRLSRITAAIKEQAPVGSISKLLLQLDPPPAAPPPSPDFEQDLVTASPSPVPLPASAQRDDRVGQPSAAELLPVMEGNFADYDVRTLLEALAVTRQYSFLQILDRNHAQLGELRIKAGMMVSARAGGLAGVDALRFLFGVSPNLRFRVLTGSFDIAANPMGSVHELIAMFAPRSVSPPERASRVIRAGIPISFFLGGAIVFLMVRGGTTTRSSGQRPVPQMTATSPAEVAAPPAPQPSTPSPSTPPPAPAPQPATPPPATPPPAPAPQPATPPPATPPPAPQAAPPDSSGSTGGTVDQAAPADKTVAIRPAPGDSVHPGMSIQTAQTALKHLGYDPGPIDNSFGRLTRLAILKFQRDHALPKTGTLDSETWSAIVALLTGN